MAEDDDRRRRLARAARERLRLDVASEGNGWSCLAADPTALARKVARAVGRHAKLPAPTCTATLMLSDDARVRALNKQWRGFDKPTNVLSFPQRTAAGSAPTTRHGGQMVHLGDVIIARQTLLAEAGELGISPDDHYSHLVLHGLLHLMGYDHETEDEAEEMEALETRILATLGVADPYAETVPAPRGTKPARKSSRSSRRQ